MKGRWEKYTEQMPPSSHKQYKENVANALYNCILTAAVNLNLH